MIADCDLTRETRFGVIFFFVSAFKRATHSFRGSIENTASGVKNITIISTARSGRGGSTDGGRGLLFVRGVLLLLLVQLLAALALALAQRVLLLGLLVPGRLLRQPRLHLAVRLLEVVREELDGVVDARLVVRAHVDGPDVHEPQQALVLVVLEHGQHQFRVFPANTRNARSPLPSSFFNVYCYY